MGASTGVDSRSFKNRNDCAKMEAPQHSVQSPTHRFCNNSVEDPGGERSPKHKRMRPPRYQHTMLPRKYLVWHNGICGMGEEWEDALTAEGKTYRVLVPV